MKVLVYPHQLVVGGSQINAIELAGAVRDRGHMVTVTAPRGVLTSMIEELRLDYVPTPVSSDAPSLRTASHLARLSSALGTDLIHAYEWRPIVESTFGPHLFCRTPLVATVLSMEVPNFLPRHVPLIVGTSRLARGLGAERSIHLIEPPIDTARNRAALDGRARARWHFGYEEVVVSVVCRLTHELEKLEGVLAAIDAVGHLAPNRPLRLLIVGGGEGLAEVRRKAGDTNARLGREVIIATAELMDPRDAYDAADIVLGMGSSALKGMAFSKPVVVQGTGGFWRLLEEESLNLFLDQGWFGHGGGGAAELCQILERLSGNTALRKGLGAFGRATVQRNFSLDLAADRLIDIYRTALSQPRKSRPRLHSLAQSAARTAKFRGVTTFRSWRRNFGAWAQK